MTSTGFHTIRWSSIRVERYQSRLQALPSTRMVGVHLVVAHHPARYKTGTYERSSGNSSVSFQGSNREGAERPRQQCGHPCTRGYQGSREGRLKSLEKLSEEQTKCSSEGSSRMLLGSFNRVLERIPSRLNSTPTASPAGFKTTILIPRDLEANCFSQPLIGTDHGESNGRFDSPG